jgi:hypothetical protein
MSAKFEFVFEVHGALVSVTEPANEFLAIYVKRAEKARLFDTCRPSQK